MKDKVIQAARALGLDVQVTSLEVPTRTVAEAAAAVGASEAQIAKTLVFKADGEPFLVVASGAHRVDADLLAVDRDCAVIEQASADEVRAATGYPVGGVSPVGTELPVILDEELLKHDRIYAAAGDGNSLFVVDPGRLAEALGARVMAVSAPATAA